MGIRPGILKILGRMYRTSIGHGDEKATEIVIDALTKEGDKRGAEIVTVIDALANCAVRAINAMSPLDIANANVRFDFGEKRELYEHAFGQVLLLAENGHDPRDLSIAFSNELTVFLPDDVEWQSPGPPIRRGVTPHPTEVVKEAMTWLTKMAIEHTPFWVKWNCKIPKSALESLERFRAFTQGFDLSQCRSIEELKARGCK